MSCSTRSMPSKHPLGWKNLRVRLVRLAAFSAISAVILIFSSSSCWISGLVSAAPSCTPHRVFFQRTVIARQAGEAQKEKKVKMCPSCGRGQRADCDGYGYRMGGLRDIMGNAVVKAYRMCPRFKGPYKMKGKGYAGIYKTTSIKDERRELLTVPATWRSLTKISLRQYPDIKSDRTGDTVEAYESFVVEDVMQVNGRHFLKLAAKKGWAFDQGVSGTWAGRIIAERMQDKKTTQ
eukprot:TRINITY_DN11823_c0_g1_i2.p1 TRINITY_DN11823_c0_g1~~TRINITY_DN11823_c0_g1_i2.p1  ORF type:complete len:261 (-),score=27.75 TRINITY_DN11823_c0_g1_i2:53-757(-)